MQCIFSQFFDVLSIGCSRCFILHDSVSVNKGPHTRYPRRKQRRASTHYRLRNRLHNGHTLIAQTFIHNHAKLRHYRVFPIPPGPISLRSADGTPLKILVYIRFALKLGNESLPVEALVLPHLGSDAMLIANIIIKAFGANLDWAAERLSFKDNDITIPTIHINKTTHQVKVQFCNHARL